MINSCFLITQFVEYSCLSTVICGFLMLFLQDIALEMSEKGLSGFIIQELYSLLASLFFYELSLHLYLLIKGEFET